MRQGLAIGGAVGVLLVGWTFALTDARFAAHMTAHMLVVAVAAPLLALGLRCRPRGLQLPAAALLACGLELVVVWAWHAPALHVAARSHLGVFVLEQSSFLLAGYGVWASALFPADSRSGGAVLAGVGALLMTSMHMSLLGGLLAIAGTPWYHQGEQALRQQQLGGAIMLGIGGVAYLVGALVLLGRALNQRAALPSAPLAPVVKHEGVR